MKMNFKKISLSIIVMSIILNIAPDFVYIPIAEKFNITAMAKSKKSGNLLGDITWELDDNGVMTISGNGDMCIQGVDSRIFDDNDIPFPIIHIAENQSPIDFILEDNRTLSVKSNEKRLGKVAPQVIGQPTNETYFDFLYSRFGYDINIELRNRGLRDSYENRVFLFREFFNVLEIYHW